MLTQGILKNHRILLFGIIVFSASIAMFVIGSSFNSVMNKCENAKQRSFVPGTVIVSTCPVVQDVGQDLTFTSYFYSTRGNVAGGETIQLPAHLKITAPDGSVLYDMDFNDKVNISFRPQMYGNYTATVTSLQEQYHPEWGDSTVISYGFGFIVLRDDVYNPLGDAFVFMMTIGGLLIYIGIGIIIYGIVKAVRKK